MQAPLCRRRPLPTHHVVSIPLVLVLVLVVCGGVEAWSGCGRLRVPQVLERQCQCNSDAAA